MSTSKHSRIIRNNRSYQTLKTFQQSQACLQSTKITKLNNSLSKFRHSQQSNLHKITLKRQLIKVNKNTHISNYIQVSKKQNNGVRWLSKNVIHRDRGNNWQNIFNNNIELTSPNIGIKVRKLKRENHVFTKDYTKDELLKFFIGQPKQNKTPFNKNKRPYYYNQSKQKSNIDDNLNRSLYKLRKTIKVKTNQINQTNKTIQISQKQQIISSKFNGWDVDSYKSKSSSSFQQYYNVQGAIQDRVNDNYNHQDPSSSARNQTAQDINSQIYSLKFDQINQTLHLIKPSQNSSQTDPNQVSINFINNEEVSITTKTQNSIKNIWNPTAKRYTQHSITPQQEKSIKNSNKFISNKFVKQSKDEQINSFILQQSQLTKQPLILSNNPLIQQMIQIQETLQKRQQKQNNNNKSYHKNDSLVQEIKLQSQISQINLTNQTKEQSKIQIDSNILLQKSVNSSLKSKLSKTQFNGICIQQDSISNLKNDEQMRYSLIDGDLNFRYTKKIAYQIKNTLVEDFSGEQECQRQEKNEVKVGKSDKKPRKSKIIETIEQFGQNCKKFFTNAIDFINPLKLFADDQQMKVQSPQKEQQQQDQNGSILQIKTLNSRIQSKRYINDLRNSNTINFKDPTIMMSQGWEMESILIIEEQKRQQHDQDIKQVPFIFKKNSKIQLTTSQAQIIPQPIQLLQKQSSFDSMLSVYSQYQYESRIKPQGKGKQNDKDDEDGQIKAQIDKINNLNIIENLSVASQEQINKEFQLDDAFQMNQDKLQKNNDKNQSLAEAIKSQQPFILDQIKIFMLSLQQTITQSIQPPLITKQLSQSFITQQIDYYFAHLHIK